jgi:hypothetical protein
MVDVDGPDDFGAVHFHDIAIASKGSLAALSKPQTG